jgi:hypothetical protein
MDDTTPEELITLAATRLSIAERELATAMGEMPLSDRADKLMVTERLRLALAEIVTAKRALSTLLDVHSRIGGVRAPAS